MAAMAFLFVIQSNENDTFGPKNANGVLWLRLKIMQRSCNQRKTKQSNTTIDVDTDDEVRKFDVHSVCSCQFSIGFCVVVLRTQSNMHHVALPSVAVAVNNFHVAFAAEKFLRRCTRAYTIRIYYYVDCYRIWKIYPETCNS